MLYNLRLCIVLLIILFIIIIYLYKYQYIIENYKIQNKPIYKKKSKYQLIELYQKNNQFALFLNKEIQCMSNEYYISHYLQCYITVSKYKPKTVLILGGGDLLCASMVLKFPFVEKVVLVEIDKEMIKMVKNNKIMMNITNNVIYNPKLKISYQDAFKYVMKTNDKYDMIIEDIEYDFTKQDIEIEQYEYINKCLKISSTMCITFDINDNSIFDDGVEYPTIRKLMNKYNYHKHYKNYQYIKIKNKINILKELEYSNNFITQMKNSGILKDIDIYVLGYQYNELFGYEAYVVFENKKLIN